MRNLGKVHFLPEKTDQKNFSESIRRLCQGVYLAANIVAKLPPLSPLVFPAEHRSNQTEMLLVDLAFTSAFVDVGGERVECHDVAHAW